MKQILTRDHAVWSLGFVASVLTFAATLADLVPPTLAPKVLAVAALCGFVAGKLGNSPLPGRPSGGSQDQTDEEK